MNTYVSAVNFFAGAGYVVDEVQFFTMRAGRPKVVFRIALPRHPRLPKKNPEECDFYSIVALGDHFAPLADHLQMGTPVVVIGYVQSRDVSVKGSQRVVSEIGAEAIYLIRIIDEDEGGNAHGDRVPPHRETHQGEMCTNKVTFGRQVSRRPSECETRTTTIG